MTWQQANYDAVKEEMRPGDVIAFAGKDGISEWIKAVTRGPVSHVGVVLRSSQAHASPQIVEATPDLSEHYGVSLRWLDEHIAGYHGDIWWLPLSDAVRSRLDLERFTTFLEEKEDLPFDVPQAIQAAADDLDHVPLVGEFTLNKEDFSALFCSELVAAGLEASGAIPSLNCSEVTPMDLLRFAIYQGTYYQVKGSKTLISGYNTVDPAGWGNDVVAERQTSETGTGKPIETGAHKRIETRAREPIETEAHKRIETGTRKPIETIYWAGVFLWAGLVFGADAQGILPQIGGASAWSWVFAGAGLLALLGNLFRAVSSDWPDPVTWDYIWAGGLLIIGLGGFVNLEIAFPLILALVGAIAVVRVFLRRD
jgi:hypothetical protein